MESSRNMKNKKLLMWQMAVAAILPVLFTGPAQAGFEWTPPPPAPAMAAPATPDAAGPAVPAAPAGDVGIMELTPIPDMPDAQMTPVEAPITAPAIERESRALPEPAIVERLDAPASAGPFADAVGFGADIPLALALGQIVPAEYAYSFASSVNPGLKISWNGGKPWNIVLNDALAPHGLRADVAGMAVIVRKAASAESAAPVNMHAMPEGEKDEKESSVYNIAPRPPADMPLMTMPTADTDMTAAAVRGEGSANYPRRTPPRQGIFGGIFTSDEHKGNQAPRPPIENNVIVRNEVAPEDMGMQSTEPAVAAALEPAAPAAVTPLPQAMAPVSLNAQKISYADEEMRQHSDVLPERTMSESPAMQVNVLDPFQVSFWQADNNANLREVLNGWAEKAGVEVIWDSSYDYKLPSSIALHGTFPEAVVRVFDLYGTAQPRPQGKLHPNLPKGPSVLLVENYP